MATTQSGSDSATQPDDVAHGPAIPPPAASRAATPVSPLAHALGLLQVTHPLPSLIYVVAVGLFSFLAAASHHQTPNGWLLARALLGVLCAQFAIGSLNDYHDRAQDAQTQPTKPLARGVIAPWEALAICVV
ncbi:MAG TPA: UbiA family prenyltransferase, partial [Ktedonobacterales bacterium]